MKVPKEESKEQNNDNTLNDDDNLSNPYDTESNSDSIDPPTRDGDFSEYMWMENQEEFDLQVNILNIYLKIFILCGTSPAAYRSE
jgi:hypothetical protein